MSGLFVFSLSLLGIAGVFLAGSFLSRFKRQARRKSSGLGAMGWALLFLGSGRIPPPPPESQIEQAAGEREHRETGRGDSK